MSAGVRAQDNTQRMANKRLRSNLFRTFRGPVPVKLGLTTFRCRQPLAVTSRDSIRASRASTVPSPRCCVHILLHTDIPLLRVIPPFRNHEEGTQQQALLGLRMPSSCSSARAPAAGTRQTRGR
ncbi:hypothetical protein BaRGS_00033253 [Batillaria attramentaria]|uniref:Uncharacterized protein n=1 Tax=Batillaria attramentaria TaxID=370345 RepID=A0ABD0JKP1_9CAEN